MSNQPNNLDVVGLIPQYYFNSMANIDPEELDQLVKYQLNIDEEYQMEVLTAFSYYEALTPEERIESRKAIADVNISEMLTFIGKNNEILLDRIEYLFDSGIPIINWLTNQLNRGKAMVLTFDQLIAEGKKYEQHTDRAKPT